MRLLTPWGYPSSSCSRARRRAARSSGPRRSSPSRRLGRRALRVRADAPDRDGVRPRRPALRRAGDRTDRRRRRREHEAARRRARVHRGARSRVEGHAPLRLLEGAARQPQPRRQAARRPQGAAEEAPERPPPAGQRRRRARRPALSRQRLDVRRLRREGPAERDDPLGAPGRPRPEDRRDGAAQSVRARRSAADRTPVRDRERPRRPRQLRAGGDARARRAGPRLRLAGLLAELRGEAARRQAAPA